MINSYNKKIILTFLFLIGLGIHAQSYKSIKPVKREIVFREISKIIDRKMFEKSLHLTGEKLKQNLKKSFQKDEEYAGREKEIEEWCNASAEAMKLIYIEDSTQIHSYNFEDNLQSFSSHVILTIVENKKETKKIKGYQCYKVVYEYKEDEKSNDEDFMDFAGNVTYKREMWVTDEIQCLYHPVVFEKSILEKYYPLEIKETDNTIHGFVTKYILQSINLQ
ncbi:MULTISPECIES: hypothetical protein [Chryseobacterium]|uniref:Uncharacterized protein n=1 Tax=Chryseobacterium taihuense TaxID=1141221 RepID=A0A4V6ID98_9FLAO|nr:MULTISPECIES: hypothetical protein [Chryseobacterium]QQV04075.1 hypothetical protein I6I61_07010 [Chryseobacterium sp. FDAARGOS 1104]VFB02564.1 Uncharacterised protein [Chryseobacterium taihuense]